MKTLALLLLTTALHAAGPVTLKLWPDGAPGKMLPHSKATEDFIRTKSGKSTLTDISDPTIEVYRPTKPNGTSVIVAPGGGYVFLSAIHEGTQVCEWLNTLGVTGILLKYRTPTRDEAAPHEKPVQDAAKAIALVREHAKEWNLDPTRVGVLGFSAGGSLLAHIACDRPAASALPNFGIMIYGGGFVDYKEPTKLKEGFTVPADAPPMFIACAHDDGQNPTASTVLYLEYKKHNIPCELHLFTKGGHGFGMRDNKQPINAWPQRCAEWMAATGFLSSLANIEAQIQLSHEYARSLRGPIICTDEVGDAKRRISEFEKAADSSPVSQRTLKELKKYLEDAISRDEESSRLGGELMKTVQPLKSLEALRRIITSKAADESRSR